MLATQKNDLVIVYPMTAMTGYINYIQYTAGSNKGTEATYDTDNSQWNNPVQQGYVFNDPFRLGKAQEKYTSSKVVEGKPSSTAAGVVAGTLNWTPVVAGGVEFVVGSKTYRDDGEGNIYVDRTVTSRDEVDQSTGNLIPAGTVINAGTLVTGGLTGSKGIDYTTGQYSFTDGTNITAVTTVLCNYAYDNVVIPQNDIPMLSARMASLPLFARARRIAVYYSQMAAFQAKTDYGFDLGDQLAEKAVGQLSYEIDTEVCKLLIDNAVQKPDLVWSKTLPIGVNKADHYNGFVEVIERARQAVYDATQRFAPNYMLISSSVLPILTFINGFTAAPAGKINGPYFAGTLNSVKVYVTPALAPGKFVLGVNGDDMASSAAVYAPYMPIVPTQLLQYADGGTSQGFSTLYDLRILNKDLLVAGEVID